MTPSVTPGSQHSHGEAPSRASRLPRGSRHPKNPDARLRLRARERAGEAAVSDMSNGFSFGDPE